MRPDLCRSAPVAADQPRVVAAATEWRLQWQPRTRCAGGICCALKAWARVLEALGGAACQHHQTTAWKLPWPRWPCSKSSSSSPASRSAAAHSTAANADRWTGQVDGGLEENAIGVWRTASGAPVLNKDLWKPSIGPPAGRAPWSRARHSRGDPDNDRCDFHCPWPSPRAEPPGAGDRPCGCNHQSAASPVDPAPAALGSSC